MTPRARLGNHPNPLVRSYGLADPPACCESCTLFEPYVQSRGAGTCDRRGGKRHLADWDACALYETPPPHPRHRYR